MAENIKAGELYLEVKASLDTLKKDLDKLKTFISGKAKDSEKMLYFKARFDNALARLRISELQNLHGRLKKELERKIKLDVSARSIELTETKLRAVEQRLKAVNLEGQKISLGFSAGLSALFLKIGGIAALIRVTTQAIQSAQNQIIAEKQVEQAVKQTGFSAGYTANEIKKLASQLQTLTGVGDDTILTDISNQLLTFTNISGEAFRRAHKAVLDLNAVIAKGEVSGLSSQAIQLGKALENPINGVTALTRVGVTFTEQQKAQIKEFVKMNDLASAQKIILDEIEAKYGNQAEALNKATGGIKNFTAAVGDLLEILAKPLLSLFQAMATELNKVIDMINTAPPSFDELSKSVKNYETTLLPLVKRYDELKSKTNLSKQENEELSRIISQISSIVPIAATQWDKYGTATEISTKKIYDFIEAEKKRLAVVNKEQIESYQKQLEQAKKQKELLEKEREQITKTGKRTAFIPATVGVTKIELKTTNKDITDLNNKIRKLQEEIEGTSQQIKYLKGEIETVDTAGKNNIPQRLTYADELLNAYEEEKTKLDDINKALKETNLTDEQKNILLKERAKLMETLFGKEQEINKSASKYTAEQLFQFDQLRFAVEGYTDFRKEQIELTYKQELKKAQGNADLIKQAEENKNLALLKLKQEETDFKQELNNKQYDDYKNTIEAIEKTNEQHLKELQNQQIKYQQEQSKALEEYYNNVKELDDTYWQYKIEQIRKQAEEFELLTGDSVKAKQLELAQLQELEQAYFDWRIEQLRNNYGVTSIMFSTHLDALESGYRTFWSVIGREDMTGAEKRQAIWESMKQAALQTIGEMVLEYIKKMLMMAVVGDAIKTQEVAKGIALGSALYSAYAPAAIAASIMSFGSASAIGLGAFTSAVALSQMSKAMSAIPKFATGGDFIVPPNFPNDSFPIRVESGERVKITPKGQTGAEAQLLVQVIDSIRALTQTMSSKSNVVNIEANIDSLKFTAKETIPSMKKIVDRGWKVD